MPSGRRPGDGGSCGVDALTSACRSPPRLNALSASRTSRMPAAMIATVQRLSYTAYLKLFTASASLSWHSNTVSSFVIDSRSLMRLVVFNSFKAPPPLFIVA